MIALAVFYASMHQPIRLESRAIRRAMATTSQRISHNAKFAKFEKGPKV